MSRQMTPSAGACAWIAKAVAILALLVWSLTHVNLAWAQDVRRQAATSGPYRGITLLEVYTNVDSQIKLPKNPPFEVKVYRMDAIHVMNQALESRTPKGLDYDQKKAWQNDYVKRHQAEFDRYAEMVAQALEGGSRLEDYRIRFRINPGVVINRGEWATQGEHDINKVIAQFQRERRQ